jgi:hypothetical protein
LCFAWERNFVRGKRDWRTGRVVVWCALVLGGGCGTRLGGDGREPANREPHAITPRETRDTTRIRRPEPRQATREPRREGREKTKEPAASTREQTGGKQSRDKDEREQERGEKRTGSTERIGDPQAPQPTREKKKHFVFRPFKIIGKPPANTWLLFLLQKQQPSFSGGAPIERTENKMLFLRRWRVIWVSLSFGAPRPFFAGLANTVSVAGGFAWLGCCVRAFFACCLC